MSESNSSLTFFFSGGTAEREALEPLAEEAESRGYSYQFSTDLASTADIGVYNTHVHPDDTVNADNSVILVNSIDDGYDPEYFWREWWNRFDIGLLPGRVAAENWSSVSWNRYSRPRNGVYDVGWPKSDRVYTTEFDDHIRQKAKELGITGSQTVLYAPAEESAGKMADFLDAADGIADALLIKHKGDEDYSNLNTNEYQSDIIILDSKLDIFEALALGDLLVSEQSGVIPEAIHTNTAPISVLDWPVNFSIGTTYPDSTLPEFTKTTTVDNLRAVIASYFDDEWNVDFDDVRSRHFSNTGESAARTMDVIEAVFHEESVHSARVSPGQAQPTVSKREKLYTYSRINLEKQVPPKYKRRLVDLGVGKILMKLDSLFINR